MADHFPDATKKVDFISREAMHKANRDEWQGVYGFVDCDIFEDNEGMIDRVPAADVVSRDCYDRILAENDTMRKQLAQIGKKPGDKMDDVRPVVRATWKRIDYKPCGHDYECSSCGWKNDMETHFCPTCGADMRPEKNDQRGKQQGRENRKTLR